MKLVSLAATAMGAFALLAAPRAEAAVFAGSTYTFEISGNTVLSATGSFPNQTSSVFCIGPADDPCATSGFAGVLSLTDATATAGAINIAFFGGSFAGGQPFTITLRNFVTPGGLAIQSIGYSAGSLAFGQTFGITSPWDGSAVTFTGSVGGAGTFDAGFSTPFVFAVTLGERDVVAAPEPGTMALLGAGLIGLVAARRRRGRLT